MYIQKNETRKEKNSQAGFATTADTNYCSTMQLSALAILPRKC